MTSIHRLSLNGVTIIVEKPCSREVQVIFTKYQNLCSINGQMVALCVADSENDPPECIGYGEYQYYSKRWFLCHV